MVLRNTYIPNDNPDRKLTELRPTAAGTLILVLPRHQVAAFAVRSTGEVVGFNELALQTLALDETVGLNWWEAAKEPDRDALIRAWVEGATKAEPFELEVTCSFAAFASPVLALHDETRWFLTF